MFQLIPGPALRFSPEPTPQTGPLPASHSEGRLTEQTGTDLTVSDLLEQYLSRSGCLEGTSAGAPGALVHGSPSAGWGCSRRHTTALAVSPVRLLFGRRRLLDAGLAERLTVA